MADAPNPENPSLPSAELLEAKPNQETIIPTPPEHKPDYGLYVGILFGIVGVFFFALQSNGVEVNWVWSAFIYAACTIGAVWTTLKHALPGSGRAKRVIVVIPIVLICAILGSIGTTKQYHKEHPTSSNGGNNPKQPQAAQQQGSAAQEGQQTGAASHQPSNRKQRQHPANTHATPDEKPPTLLDLFTKNFPNTLKASSDVVFTRKSDGTQIHVKSQVYLDFEARTKFVGFYIPAIPAQNPGDEMFILCQALVSRVQPTVNDLPKKVQIWGGYRGQNNDIDDLVFSGRVFLYYEGLTLSIPQQADLINTYKASGYDVQFRDDTFLGDQLSAWYREHGPPKPPQ
jgi:hypothetical protein